ncbi:MAG: transposase, partial [Pseudomonadota bacterium]
LSRASPPRTTLRARRSATSWSASTASSAPSRRLLANACRAADECLNLHWFRSLRHARAEIAAWRNHYNTERPHSALGYLSPKEVLDTTAASSLEPLAGSAPALTATNKPENSSSARP